MFLFRFADYVSIGDEILAQGIDNLTPEKVINISNSVMQGKHNFMESKLIIESKLVSNCSHNIAHM